jgi:hypothetical protein
MMSCALRSAADGRNPPDGGTDRRRTHRQPSSFAGSFRTSCFHGHLAEERLAPIAETNRGEQHHQRPQEEQREERR